MKVGIVGAGITGLALTHHLREQGVEVVTLEADSEPGGVLDSERIDGHLVEHGPQRTRLTDDIEALVDDLGLREDVVDADPSLPLYVYADGKLGRVPFSIGTFLRTDLLSWRGKLRLLGEPLTAPGSEDEMAADLFTRKFGAEAYRNFIGPLFGGIYGSDPAEMPAGYAPSPILKLEQRSGSLLKPALKRAFKNERTPPISFEEGLQQLPEALHAANAPAITFDRPVEAISENAEGFVLETGEEDEHVDRVVVTTPADIAAGLLADLAPDATDRLRKLTYNPLALVHLIGEVDREGYGYQVRRDEDLRTLGVSWNSGLFGRTDEDGRGVYTAFLGGMNDHEIIAEDDETIGEIAAGELEEVMGVEAELLNVTRLPRGFPAWDTSWEVLDDLELPDGIYLATNYTARMGIPGRLRQAEQLAEQFAAEAEEAPATGAEEATTAGPAESRQE